VQAHAGTASWLDGTFQGEQLDGKVLRTNRPFHGGGGRGGGGKPGTQDQDDLAKTRHT